MRIISLFALMFTSCVTQSGTPTAPVYSGALSYPKTVITLPTGTNLIHEAGALDSQGDNRKGTPPLSSDLSSRWTLESPHQPGPLVSVLSDLIDPAYSGEFEDYNRKNDRVLVYQSETGNTIVIVEDRSPHYPNRDYFVMRKMPSGDWGSQALPLEPYVPSQDPNQNFPAGFPLESVFPAIIEVQDHGLRCTAPHGTQWVSFNPDDNKTANQGRQATVRRHLRPDVLLKKT